MIRSDDGREFRGSAMAISAQQENGVLLRFIEPGKPNQNAYANGRPIVLAESKK